MGHSKNVKKLFSLARIKIRLAEEAGTVDTLPKPLPVVRLFSGVEVSTVAEAKSYVDVLKSDLTSEDMPDVILQLLDIVEGVKYEFDPVLGIPESDFRRLEGKPATLLFYCGSFPDSVGVESGSHSVGLGPVPSSAIHFIRHAFSSDYFSDGKKLKNVSVKSESSSPIINGIVYAIEEFVQ